MQADRMAKRCEAQLDGASTAESRNPDGILQAGLGSVSDLAANDSTAHRIPDLELSACY